MTRIDAILSNGLIKKGLFSKDALTRLAADAQDSALSLGAYLIKNKTVQEKEVLAILSEELKVPVIDLKVTLVEKAVIEKIPQKIANYYKFLPLRLSDRTLTIAVSYPLDTKTQDEIRTQLGFDLEFCLVPSQDLAEGMSKYYNVTTQTVEKLASSVPLAAGADTGLAADQERVEDIEKLAGDASIIKLVNQIILEAFRKRATDIHIEPYRSRMSLRYRVDGILYEEPVPPEIRNFISSIISRIKIMSNLNIVERRLPQDGRAVVKVAEQVLDLRISTIPTPFGESVVIRILPTQMLFDLAKLGLARRDLDIFERLIGKPHGIVFVTGPTGSGKTTTLYAALNKINTTDRKIITIEDPIEYEMPGITQIQVMPDVGLDFARGLRSILRHDPDVIMVGEVRDLETAEIAIRVALTGHLVFSTLHTNDAASGITRLIDIGVEPYLVSSSVEAFVAQRLVRLNCPQCKQEDAQAPMELRRLIARDLAKPVDEVRIWRGKGCSNCNFTGFFGRTAIYEVISIDTVIKDLILKKTPSGQIKRAAISRGMRTLAQDGWEKVCSGLTTPEEVMRVTAAEEREAAPVAEAAVVEEARIPVSEPVSDDRRVFIRLDSNINVRFKVFRSQEELVSQGFRPEEFSITKNISAGGLLFISNEALAFGMILEIYIDLPQTSETVQCLARVVRAEQSGRANMFDIAVCFLDLTSAQRAKLEKFVEQKIRIG